MHRLRKIGVVAVYASFVLVFGLLGLWRPPASFYAFPLLPIALAALLHEFTGGALAALLAVAGVGMLLALDPDAARRGQTLLAAWPILLTYLALGPFVGWLAGRERKQDRAYLAAERRWSRQMEAISEACREIADALDLDRTLRRVMEKAIETLPMDAGAVFQLDAATQNYRVVVTHNLSVEHASQITFEFDEGVPGWVVRHRQPLVVDNAATDARVHPRVVRDGVQSVLAIPLIARERVVGVLNLYSKSRKHAFDADAVRLAQVFADQAAVFVENARLVDQLRAAAAELEARVERRTEQLRASQAQVVRSAKLAAVGRVAATIAHEVNNPLQAIALQLQLIDADALAGESSRRLVIVQSELTRIASLVQRMLDFQRPAPGARALHDVEAVLDDVLALAENQLQTDNVRVNRDYAATLPRVLLNPGQMKQVLLNLVLNARDAMPDGGELLVRTSAVDETLEITIADTGAGMTTEVMSHLFEPFYSTKSDGNGLGLAVSHDIVTQHGGQLLVSSTPGVGSDFRIRLPLPEVAHA